MTSSLFNINPGAVVSCGESLYTVELMLDLDTVLAREETAGKSVVLPIKNLGPVTALPSGAQLQGQELSLIKDDDWKEAEHMLAHLSPLLGGERRTKEMVEKVAGDLGVHYVTVYRMINRYELTGQTSELIRSRSNGGKGKSRLPEDVESIIQATIKEFYVKGRRRTVKKVYDEIKRRLMNNNIQPPHKNTIYNRIKAITQKEKDEAQLGAKEAKKLHTAHPGHYPDGMFPLSDVQIDHTKLDIELVDDVDRLPIGRPWITLAMDVYSRMVIGFYISFDPPNAMSVGLCLAHAILPKEAWLDRLDIKVSWPCWGFMRRIYADNAGEFRGKMLKRACKEYAVDLQWRPVKQPHYGAHIERLLGTLLKEIHALHGTTYSNINEKGDYDSEGEAKMTLSQFELWFTNLVVGAYHQRKHSTLNTSPIKQLEVGIIGTKTQPGTGFQPKVLNEDRLRLDLMPFETRTVQADGITIDKITYYSPLLDRYVGLRIPGKPNKRPTYICKRDPRNIKFIYFYDPETKEYYEIPYRDMSRPAMSIWEYRAVRRHIAQNGVDDQDVDEALIFKTYDEMRAIEEKAIRETKAARRARQRRSQNAQITRPKTAAQTQPDGAENQSSLDSKEEELPLDEDFEIDDSLQLNTL